jgi:hypothetical protein
MEEVFEILAEKKSIPVALRSVHTYDQIIV